MLKTSSKNSTYNDEIQLPDPSALPLREKEVQFYTLLYHNVG